MIIISNSILYTYRYRSYIYIHEDYLKCTKCKVKILHFQKTGKSNKVLEY